MQQYSPVMAIFRKTSRWLVLLFLPSLCRAFVNPFVSPLSAQQAASSSIGRIFLHNNNGLQQQRKIPSTTATSLQQSMSVQVEAELTDEKVTALFAWIAQAYAGEYEYNNLMLAFAAIFGNLPEDSEPVQLAQKALKLLPKDAEDIPCGEPFSLDERESNSLGAMG